MDRDRLIRDAKDVATWVRRRVRSAPGPEREMADVAMLEKVAAIVAPSYVVTEGAKAWFGEDGFLADYDRLEPLHRRSADRKFAVWALAATVVDLPGDSAEAGVFRGATSWFICDALAGSGKTHHAFDSFEGLSEPTGTDGAYWTAGDLAADDDRVRRLLEPYGGRVYRGWIPAVFDAAALGELCFAHVDVDLYEPTLASLERFYPLLSAGGMLVCDDYGFETCPGARRAVDEYMAGRRERVAHLPTGQALIIKR